MRLTEVPVVTLTGLSEGRARMLRLALNRLAEDSHWSRDALQREFTEILQIEAEIEIAESGFEKAGLISAARNSLRLHPCPRPATDVARAEPLRDDAFEPQTADDAFEPQTAGMAKDSGRLDL